jgi:hypothetical protein
MANLDNIFGDIHWQLNDLTITDKMIDAALHTNEYWVSETYPFTVRKVIDSNKRFLMNNMRKVMYYMDGNGEYFKELFDDEKMPDDAPTYKHKETAQMYSNLFMYRYLKRLADQMDSTKFSKREIGAAKGWATRYKNKAKKYQEEYPERCL